MLILKKGPLSKDIRAFLGSYFCGFQFPKTKSTVVIVMKNDKVLDNISKMIIDDSYLENLYLTFVGIYLNVLFKTPMTFYC